MSEPQPTPQVTPLPENAPAMKAILTAQQQGYDHAWHGHNLHYCPYGSGEAILRRAWAAGYAAAKTELRARHGLPVDHGHIPEG